MTDGAADEGPGRPLVTSRDIALDVLLRVEGGAFSNVLLPSLLRASNLEDRDRAFTTDLVYGTLRSQRALDDVLERVLDRKVARLDAPVRAGLRMGVYQLVEGVAPHAAVSATVLMNVFFFVCRIPLENSLVMSGSDFNGCVRG